MTASLEALFAQHDIALLGFADTAFVFARPGEPEQVVKVGIDVGDGWPAWAVWCGAQASPHVPRVHSLTWIKDGQGRPQLFVGLMERLQPSTALRTLIKADWSLKREPRRLADTIEADRPSVAALLRAAAAAFPGAVWDMTPSNWMERADGTLVLTDPISRVEPATPGP